MTNDANTLGYPPDVIDAVIGLRRASRAARPYLIGLSGLQGSGKSTLAAQIVARAAQLGMRAIALSIDDFYFGRAARQRLARDVHPLLITRGVPGTHEIPLLTRTLDALARATPAKPARIPRFDKGRDTRIAKALWDRVPAAPALIILEGWCIGAPPQSRPALRKPINALEREEDTDARWRIWVNRQLRDAYVPLWRRFDGLVLLQPPNYAVVRRWRDEQEQYLRDRNAPRAMDATALRRFLMHYERLSRQVLREIPARADLRIVLDENRRVRRIVRR